MKTITTILFSFSVLIILGQEKYDVRKTKWGMTISEVIASEYPLSPASTKEDELNYLNVEIGNKQKADISYRFKNLKVREVKYTIYGYKADFSKGTCSNIIPIYDKIQYTSFIFQAIKNKGMKCNLGWYIPNGLPSGYIAGFPVKSCNTDRLTVEKIANASFKAESTQIALSFENERTIATFYFNEHQNYKKQSSFEPCNAEFYNIYYWIVFSPRYNIEEELNSKEF